MSNEVKKELPENWAWTTMDEIAVVVGGGTPKSKEKRFYEGGDIPWLTPADLSGYKGKYISNGARFITEEGLAGSSAKLMPAGAVLFTSRAPIGYVVIAQNEICTNQGFKSFVLKSDDIFPDYVYWWLKGSKQLAESFASGTTFLELSGSKAKQLPIPIAPLEQQKRIVAKIEELFSHIDAGIEALNKAKALLKQYRQSVLKAAVTGELTKEWREQNKDKLEPASQLLERILKERREKWEAQQLKQFEAKGKMPKDDKWKEKYKLEEPNSHMELDVPDSWAVSTLESITDSERVICYGILMPKKNVEGGVLYVKVKDVKYGRVLVEQLNRTAPEIAAKYTRASLVEGDLLLTIRGTYGRTAIAPKELNGGNITQDTVRISAIPPILNEYLQIFIDSIVAQQYFKRVARGVAVKGVNVQDVRNMNTPIPCVKEQQEIITLVDQKITTITCVEKDIENQLIKAEKNKQSILASAFSGQLL